MIYLNVSVLNVEEALDFYSQKLGLFSRKGYESRLVCDSSPDLIIDFFEVGTKEHFEQFESNSHVKSSFAIHHDNNTKIELFEGLRKHGIQYNEEPNMMAQFIEIIDPSGNSISIAADHGVLV